MINGIISTNSIKPAQNKFKKGALTSKSTIKTTTNPNLSIPIYYYPPKISFKGNINRLTQKALFTKSNKFDNIRNNIANELDKKVFEFKTPSDKNVKGTIIDYLKACIMDHVTLEENALYHGTSKEAKDNIVKNGFNLEKVSRTIAGPGICFANNEDVAQSFGGSVVKCSYKGNTSTLEPDFYENLKTHEGFNKTIKKALGIQEKSQKEEADALIRSLCGLDDQTAQDLSRIEKEKQAYVRHALVDKLNIDGAVFPGKTAFPSCFVVYNTNKLSNIH